MLLQPCSKTPDHLFIGLVFDHLFIGLVFDHLFIGLVFDRLFIGLVFNLDRFRLSVVKSKARLSQRPIRRKENSWKSQ